MAVPWLLDLPQRALPKESSESLGENNVEFAVDIGPPMRRERSTAAYDPMTLAFKMSRTQAQLFRHDYRTRLGHGTVSFTLPRDPFTFEPAEYFFRSPPQISRLAADRYLVTFDALRKP